MRKMFLKTHKLEVTLSFSGSLMFYIAKYYGLILCFHGNGQYWWNLLILLHFYHSLRLDISISG